MASDGPLLICYDGSDGARAALETAAHELPGRRAVVAYYWQPFAQANRRTAIHILELVQEAARINEREEALAAEVADEGAKIARDAGLEAMPAPTLIEVPIDEAVLTHADELDAAAIVLGARSRSGFKSLLIGDLAYEVVQRATRPVLLVPSGKLVDRRRHELRAENPLD